MVFSVWGESFFIKQCEFSIPNPKPIPRGEWLCMLCWLCIVQSLWAYTPGIHAGAECGAAALTKQGCLQSVAHSRCTTQRHQRLTTRIGATPKARTLWLLAKSFARCKTNMQATLNTHFQKLYRFIDSLEIIRVSGLYNVIVRRILHIAVYQVLQCHTVKILVYNLVQPLP